MKLYVRYIFIMDLYVFDNFNVYIFPRLTVDPLSWYEDFLSGETPHRPHHHHRSVPKQTFPTHRRSHTPIRNFSSSTLHRKVPSPARSAGKTKAEMSPPSARLQTKPAITCLKTFLISYSLIFWVSVFSSDSPLA